MDFKKPVPVPPTLENWDFIKELSQPENRIVKWTRKRPKKNEVDLSGGITLEKNFVDKEDLLETAYDDFGRLLDEASIPRNGNYRIISEYAETELHEAFRIEVGHDASRIFAADTEGIRRGIFFLEDEILRMQGPFLPLKTFKRKPFIHTRISRCFYGKGIKGACKGVVAFAGLGGMGVQVEHNSDSCHEKEQENHPGAFFILSNRIVNPDQP